MLPGSCTLYRWKVCLGPCIEQVGQHRFSNTTHPLCVSVSHFGDSHRISNFLTMVIRGMASLISAVSTTSHCRLRGYRGLFRNKRIYIEFFRDKCYCTANRLQTTVNITYPWSVAVVQSLSRVRLFATPWTVARQASLSITISRSLLKLMSMESVMPSSHLILCRPLLLLPSIFPSIGVFSNESALPIRWPKDWSVSLSISPSSESLELMSFRMDWSMFPSASGKQTKIHMTL